MVPIVVLDQLVLLAGVVEVVEVLVEVPVVEPVSLPACFYNFLLWECLFRPVGTVGVPRRSRAERLRAIADAHQTLAELYAEEADRLEEEDDRE